jgi:tetratricopeptide (TPR) repeat protein
VRLPGSEPAQLAKRHPNPEAHDLYLKGRYFWNKRNRDGLANAVNYFQQAIEKDPQYAAAYAGLADSYILMDGYGHVTIEDAVVKARAAAEKALELDETLAEAHTSLALIAPKFDWNWDESRRHYERALELNPNYATAHHWYADGYLTCMGRMDEAVAEMRKAEQLDPLSSIIATDLGKDLYMARRYDEAIAQLRKVLALDPNFAMARAWLSAVYVEKGMYSESFAELETLKPDLSPQNYLIALAHRKARAGRTREARADLRKLLQMSRTQYVAPGSVAIVYSSLRDNDNAFLWLEKAYQIKGPELTSLKVWAGYDPIRSDPRFADLVHRVGLN